MTGIGLIVIEDEKLPGADGDVAAVDAIPFFPLQYGFEGKAADVFVAAGLCADRVEDDVQLSEPAEVQVFVEVGAAMIGQLGEIHN